MDRATFIANLTDFLARRPSAERIEAVAAPLEHAMPDVYALLRSHAARMRLAPPAATAAAEASVPLALAAGAEHQVPVPAAAAPTSPASGTFAFSATELAELGATRPLVDLVSLPQLRDELEHETRASTLVGARLHARERERGDRHATLALERDEYATRQAELATARAQWELESAQRDHLQKMAVALYQAQTERLRAENEQRREERRDRDAGFKTLLAIAGTALGLAVTVRSFAR